MLLQATKNKREESENNIKKGIAIQLQCDFCRGPISGKTHVLKFANFERFFC
jgi:Lrp/AsnC family leucine-responsive transcriptional regulator